MSNTGYGKDGINVFGYIKANMGMGQAVRQNIIALHKVGVKTTVHDVTTNGLHVETDTLLDGYITDELKYFYNYIHINADETVDLDTKVTKAQRENRYNIGYWGWELSVFPDMWLKAFDHLDEVWVYSKFIQEAVAAKTDKPVVVVPIAVPPVTGELFDREYFGIPKDKTCFLITFDLHSLFARKNPLGAIDAFRRAFSEKDNALLVIKLHSGRHDFTNERKMLYDNIKNDPKIFIIDKVLTRQEQDSLQNCIDCYISLHRSEGFGLNIAECMALGKPVIATDYSGNTDFMSSDEAFAVPYTMTDVKENEYPCWQGQHWAEPDLGAAAEYMRKIYRDPEYAAEIGRKARARILKELSYEAVGKVMKDRLDQLNTLLGK
ncbi:MAG: glycosyltransferase family 4 protein [Deferribacterales bacterium]